MDFPTIALIIIAVILIGTVMAAGGLKELIPPKAPSPAQPAARGLPPRLAPAGGGEQEAAWNEDSGGSGGWPWRSRSGAKASSATEATEDPADNFFSDEDDYVFREPDANRAPFSQREEDRDSLDDPDRNR